MKFVVIAALLVAATVASTGVPVVTVCSASNALLQDLTYTITPNNIEPGSDLKIALKGTLTGEITSGSIVVSASFDNIPIITKTLNLCNELSCPVPKGPFQYTVAHNIPNLPVSGTVTAQATIDAQNNQQVTCVDVTVSI
ncbi:membrane-associated protein, putative [Bodo saltans]|uniref:Membrane-associated protein, putative n=1 Tax=Bodo saltans TaxID=75058 RepID=A0A0S4JMY1_BODSA|nr:membrane-associated protein, putative [Bodo saltans]|eukprot:CUG90758.1 membrane-associated protein, putative [Bodo saltans]